MFWGTLGHRAKRFYFDCPVPPLPMALKGLKVKYLKTLDLPEPLECSHSSASMRSARLMKSLASRKT